MCISFQSKDKLKTFAVRSHKLKRALDEACDDVSQWKS